MAGNAEGERGSSDRSLTGTALAALTFRASREELDALDWRHLLIGLILTWGMGAVRNWGDPGVAPILSMGFGWVLYVLGFAVLVWLLLRPLAASTFGNLLTFLALAMPLALVYTVPAEFLFGLGTVEDLDARPLALIAAWPVVLSLFYARRALALDWTPAAVVVLMPACLIVAGMSLVNTLPGLVAFVAEAIMMVLFGKPVDEAALEEAAIGYVTWQVMFYLALAAFTGLLAAYAVEVYRRRSRRHGE